MKLFLYRAKRINTLTPFNKGGNRITSRIPVEFSSSEAPFGTRRAERLLIEREFGNKRTDVNLFYDSSDRLIGQKRENYQGDTLIDYIESRYTVRRNVNWKNYIISLSDVQSITYAPDNSITSGVRNKVDIVKENEIEAPFINIMKYHSTRNGDNTFSEKFSISNEHNQIKTESVRSASGDLLKVTTAASENIPQEVANDEYLILRGMPDEIAIKSLLRIFGKKERLENPDDIQLFYIKGDDLKYELGVTLHNPAEVGIGLMPTLGENIDTTSHELRHLKQYELRNKLKNQLRNKFFNKKEYNPRELKLALYFLKCKLQECPFPVAGWLTKKWYLASGIEKDAFRIGARYKADFQRRTKKLKKFFPMTTRHNMGLEPTLPN